MFLFKKCLDFEQFAIKLVDRDSVMFTVYFFTRAAVYKVYCCLRQKLRSSFCSFCEFYISFKGRKTKYAFNAQFESHGTRNTLS